jgi:eukaryotic-like serine/threonine-protein kinase
VTSTSVPPLQASPLAPGFKLDRYELLCPIAEGGMASVWIARQTGKHGFEKLVAIKTILPKYAADTRFQQMFLDEARIASRIEHSNVAQILDVGEQHGTTYLVMEYVDGDSLSTVQRAATKRNVSIPQGMVLRMMAEVCGGLHAAHELRNEQGGLLGVVHRDVSPQNVLVSVKGVAKLIDFGIAKARDRVAGDTNADTLKGKVRYMAPEQAQGLTVDRRADVWAVGAIMYHLLAGKPPFDGENDMQTLLMLTSGRPPPPLPRAVHPAVSHVVMHALTSIADRRYRTAADMQQAIHEAAIEANASSSATTIAAFLAEHVGEASRRRKEAISLGVKSATDREKYAEIMRANVRVPGAGSASGVSEAPSSSRSGLTGSRSGTLGSSSAMIVGPAGGSNKRTVVALAVAAVAVVALAGTLVATRGQKSSAGPTAKSALPRPSSTPAASPGATDNTVNVQSLPAVVVAATDLPEAPAAPSASASSSPALRPGAPRPAGRNAGGRRHVDDGF